MSLCCNGWSRDVQYGVTIHFRRLNGVNSEPIHCDGGGAKLDGRAFPGGIVGLDAVDFFGTEQRRALL